MMLGLRKAGVLCSSAISFGLTLVPPPLRHAQLRVKDVRAFLIGLITV